MRKSKARARESEQEIYSSARPVLLDTHVWFWLMSEDKKSLNAKCLEEIRQAQSCERLKVSAISVWEIGMMGARGRIQFPLGCFEWVYEALGAPGISLAPLSPEIAVEANYLPGYFHGDPADRILIATARQLSLTLMTHDAKILQYARQGHVNVSPL